MTSDFSMTACHCLFFFLTLTFFTGDVSKMSVSSFNCFTHGVTVGARSHQKNVNVMMP